MEYGNPISLTQKLTLQIHIPELLLEQEHFPLGTYFLLFYWDKTFSPKKPFHYLTTVA